MVKKKVETLSTKSGLEILAAIQAGFARMDKGFRAVREDIAALSKDIGEIGRDVQTLVSRTGSSQETTESHEVRIKRIEQHLGIAMPD